MVSVKHPWPLVSSLLWILFISFATSIYINRFDLADWWQLRSYQAPAAVVTLATQTTMNGNGRKLFFVNHPAIQDKQDFNGSCRENEQTIVLGCYIQNKGIYVLDVTDARLDGVEQVTSAHEMLHAAYERLNSADKKRINQLLLTTYNDLHDDRITATINSYQQASADTVNELHSILGTEVAKLPPELETYYQRYFTNRSAIVTYSAKYEGELTGRKDKIIADDKQLTDLEAKIQSNNAELDQQQAALKSQKETLNGLRQSGNIPAYNAGVAPYNNQVNTFNALVAQTNKLVAQYRTVLNERNALAEDLQTLAKSLDSRITSRSEL